MQTSIEYILIGMSDVQKKKLYFIKSPQHNLKAIENFLTKRNYEVIIESDLKTSLLKILEIYPDYVFMAWDHTNQKIATLPKAINQSIITTIVPYSQSTAKEFIRKLEYSGFPNKLYPPLSGPAIERLILKLQKESSLSEQSPGDDKHKRASKNTAQTDDVINVRSKTSNEKQNDKNIFNSSKTNTGSNTTIIESMDTENADSSNELHFQKGVRGELLKTKNNINQDSSTKAEVDELLSSTFMDDLEAPTEEGASEKNFDPTGKLHFQKGVRGELLKSKNNQLSSFRKKPLDLEKKDQLKKGFEEDVKLNLQDILSTYLESENNQGDSKSDSNASTSGKMTEPQLKKMAYCLSVSSSSWCGYLIAYCDIAIDYQSLETVFTNWLKENFENFMELDEMDHFEISVEKNHFKAWAQNNSEYYENITHNESEFLICFISVDPKLFVLSLDEEEKYIEIPIENIPTESDLKLSLYLHLPVNKKYLLYTPESQQLNSDQKKRLLDKNIDKLFTPTEYEKAYKMTIAEQQLNVLLSEIKSEAIA